MKCHIVETDAEGEFSCSRALQSSAVVSDAAAVTVSDEEMIKVYQ